jgi:hypothetical protein
MSQNIAQREGGGKENQAAAPLKTLDGKRLPSLLQY